LRLLARQSSYFFNLTNWTICKIADYIENVKKKLQKEKSDAKVNANAVAAVSIKEEAVEASEETPELMSTHIELRLLLKTISKISRRKLEKNGVL
jgi:hypothetical protein